MSSMDLLVVSVFFFLSPLLSLGSSDRSHNALPERDQIKGGGRPGVQRTPKFGAREQRFDLTKIQLSSKLSPKDPKEFAKKFRDATGEPREKRLLQITNLKATLQRLHRLYIYHTEKRSGRATPEIFLWQSHSRRESSRRTSRLEGFC